MPESLSGREVILAGGAGGLGSETARLLAQEDADLLITYRTNREAAQRLADFGRVFQCDLTEGVSRASLLDEAKSLYGLVVFSGVPARVSEAGGLEDAMQLSHQANYAGPILLAREAAEKMRAAATPGAIVLISTMQAIDLFPGSTAYAGAKAALLHAGRILAKECRGAANIRVNVICPGVNDAGMAQASIALGKYDRFLNEGTIGRFGQARDVARAVRFFLEPDNYITGQVLTVDGGLTL